MMTNFIQFITNNLSQLLNSFIDLVGIIVGVLIILWRMNKHHKSSIQLQKHNFQEELRLKLYNQLAEKISSANRSISKTMAYISFLPSRLLSSFGPIEDRAETLSSLNTNLEETVNELIETLSRYEIVNPSLGIFRKMLHYQSNLCRKAFHKFYSEVIKFLPVDLSKEKVESLNADRIIARTRPTEEQTEQLRKLASDYSELCWDLGSYIFDLGIEAQNSLLGSIFNRVLPHREPRDSKMIVITTDPSNIKKLDELLQKSEEYGH